MTRIADLFCGAGGETGGIVDAASAAGLSIDLAAVNHWQVAIETHKLNFPDARTYCHDLAALNPHDVFNPREKVDLLWASPECTHHSIARGGRPCSDQSRASAWLILKWLSELYVRRVILENVPEFLNWGPLGSDGKPLPSGRGAMFRAFVDALKALGYRVDWRLLCAADYGDPTTRKRFFLQAVRGNGRIVWPEPTHAETPGLFDRKPWATAREVIDWSIPGKSIFDRKKPLAPATMRRIEEGIRRYWGDWAEPFLVRYNSGDNRVHSLTDPLPVIDCSNRYGLVEPFIVPQFGERQGQTPRTHSIVSPLPAVTSHGAGALVEPFLVHYYGNGGAEPIRIPLATVTTHDRFGLIEGTAGLDITLRMLAPHELAAAQGFPHGYRFAGNKGDAVKQIGNSVPRGLAKALAFEALTA